LLAPLTTPNKISTDCRKITTRGDGLTAGASPYAPQDRDASVRCVLSIFVFDLSVFGV
jgi:hypothetical protein